MGGRLVTIGLCGCVLCESLRRAPMNLPTSGNASVAVQMNGLLSQAYSKLLLTSNTPTNLRREMTKFNTGDKVKVAAKATVTSLSYDFASFRNDGENYTSY